MNSKKSAVDTTTFYIKDGMTLGLGDFARVIEKKF